MIAFPSTSVSNTVTQGTSGNRVLFPLSFKGNRRPVVILKFWIFCSRKPRTLKAAGTTLSRHWSECLWFGRPKLSSQFFQPVPQLSTFGPLDLGTGCLHFLPLAFSFCFFCFLFFSVIQYKYLCRYRYCLGFEGRGAVCPHMPSCGILTFIPVDSQLLPSLLRFSPFREADQWLLFATCGICLSYRKYCLLLHSTLQTFKWPCACL